MADRTYIHDMVKQLSYLPNCPIKTRDDIAAVDDMFFVILKDLSIPLLDAAVMFYLGQSTPFFPMPGTLRQKALELQMIALRVPTGTEAWGMVLNCSYSPGMVCPAAATLREELTRVIGGEYLAKVKELSIHENECTVCRPVSFEPVYSHELVGKTVRLLGGLDAILTDNPTADRARFIQAYNEILEREQSIIGMVPEVRQFVQDETLRLEDEHRAALDTGEAAEIQEQFRLAAREDAQMINDELSTQFRLCEQWQDADQWEALGFLYYARGYMMNAGYCFRKCDECRAAILFPVMDEAVPA